MGRIHKDIDQTLASFLLSQPVFFVATAPLSGDGHVNCSPKGVRDTFAVLGPTQVAYLDLSGSGAETVAHVQENGRITVMFCAFAGAPRIVRLSGKARAAIPPSEHFTELVGHFPSIVGARAVIDISLDRISDSCGFGVPLMEYQGDRPTLGQWAQRKGPEGLANYRERHNAMSIDGLVSFGGPEAD